MITIAYVNFWNQNLNNTQDWWLSEFIKHNIDPDIKLINHKIIELRYEKKLNQ